MSIELVRGLIRDVPDFPKPGIVFKDIAPLLESGEGLRATVELMAEATRELGGDALLGIESRGFLLGSPVAFHLGLGFGLIRKPGKLPRDVVRQEYALEYGTDAIELHRDAIAPGAKVVIIDDVLATGGTAAAACELVRSCGAEIAGCVFLMELGFLRGRDKLGDVPIRSLLTY